MLLLLLLLLLLVVVDAADAARPAAVDVGHDAFFLESLPSFPALCIPSYTQAFMHPSIHASIHASIHFSSIHLINHASICPFVHPFVLSSVQFQARILGC